MRVKEAGNRLGERLLSAEELADFLGVPRSAVYRLACDGEIAFLRVGRQFRFTPEAVDAFVAERQRRVPRLEGAP